MGRKDDLVGYSNEFNFEKAQNPHFADYLISQSLSSVSTHEIISFIKRVNFYMEHFSIINKRQKCPSIETKVSFLRKVSKFLNEEIQNRESIEYL